MCWSRLIMRSEDTERLNKQFLKERDISTWHGFMRNVSCFRVMLRCRKFTGIISMKGRAPFILLVRSVRAVSSFSECYPRRSFRWKHYNKTGIAVSKCSPVARFVRKMPMLFFFFLLGLKNFHLWLVQLRLRSGEHMFYCCVPNLTIIETLSCSCLASLRERERERYFLTIVPCGSFRITLLS